MFKAKYTKGDVYRLDIVFLETEVVGSFESDTLKEAIDGFIEFEEEFYSYKFTKEEKELKTKSAELICELQDCREEEQEELLNEIFEVNKRLQILYISGGFEKIRNTYKQDFLKAEMEELEEEMKELEKEGDLNG